ncbi:sugar phosphate isomerase/epimerase family protein [Epilithonimonas arachidiradicis]|uniref:Sugar phosphate isomerase n=1 Tax=Epilithonimonas arachidiradicis TaxID=1617282 RepID=A0A420CKU5_9FLAO|nr:sugar phosphate isomerase/epimerase [Epilithonimonas arachidiradicis]RKE79107.1 sugar phosphate isomerase/epimerase [Epilithonimonas arachidiradicis]GGG60306.1 sugar phosphate isomerase [Epilithonimonas arachidiradicis]
MNRKDFISLSGLGFLGLYACGTSNLMNNRKPLAIQLYTIRDAVAENLEKSLERLAQLGFKQLEIYGYEGKFFGKSRTEFHTILKNVGLEVISSHHTTGIVHNSKGTLLNDWEKSVEDLHFIGSKYMVCSYLFEEERTLEHYKKLPELLNKSGEVTNKAGIDFAYHNHDFEFEKLEDKTVYDFILENTDFDLVKMELDLYWISKAGLNPLDYFEKYPKRFPLWHVKDMKAGTKDFAEIGNGTIDFKSIFEAKEKAGLKYWFLEQDSSDKDIFESIKISKNYIDNHSYFKTK